MPSDKVHVEEAENDEGAKAASPFPLGSLANRRRLDDREDDAKLVYEA